MVDKKQSDKLIDELVGDRQAPQEKTAGHKHYPPPVKEILVVNEDLLRSKRKPSAGEKIFNRVVYTGVGFGVNEAMSLYLTDEFEHGKGKPWSKWFGKEGFDKTANWAVSFFKMKDHVKDGKTITALKSAKNGLMTVALLTGGTILIWPIRKLEEHKGYWSEKINHTLDKLGINKLSPEEVKERDAEVEKAVACAPKQSWPSLLIGRALAVASTVSFGIFVMGKERNSKVSDFSQDVINKTVRSGGKLLGTEKNQKLNSFFASKIFQRYARLTGVETIYCFISSVILEAASKFAAKENKSVSNPEKCEPFNGTVVPYEPSSTSTTTPKATYSQQVAKSSSQPGKEKPSDSYTGMVASQRKAAEESPQIGAS